MAVKIKLKRIGKMRAPQYRIVIADARTKRDGRSIEEIGKYHPKEHPSFIEVNRERAQYWLGVGAQPTEAVLAILKVTGDWQTFKGLPGAEGTLQMPAARADKRAIFEAAAKESLDAPTTEAITPKAKKAPKVEAPKVEAPKVEAPTEVEAPKVEAPKVEAPKVEAPVEAPKVEAPVEAPKVEAPTEVEAVAEAPAAAEAAPAVADAEPAAEPEQA